MITVGLRLLQWAPVLLFVLLSACATPVSPEQIASADYGKLPSIISMLSLAKCKSYSLTLTRLTTDYSVIRSRDMPTFQAHGNRPCSVIL